MAKKLEEGDEERDRYLEALENGYRFKGYVNFDKERATDPIAKHLGLDEKGFIELMIKYLRSGGRLDCVDESRPDWKHWRRPPSGTTPMWIARVTPTTSRT